MSLSDRDKEVIVAIQHRANVPFPRIARLLKVREHTIRYAVEKLEARKIIMGRSPFINVYPLGYTDFQLFFVLREPDVETRDKIIQALVKSRTISWVAKLGGDFDYGISILAKRVEDAGLLLEKLAQRFGDVLADRALIVRRTFHAFVRKYLAPHVTQWPEMYFGAQAELASIDDLDHRILSLIANQGMESHREIGRLLSIPHTTVSRRLESLEERKLISGYIYRFDLSSLGNNAYRIMLVSRGLSPAFTKELYDFCKQHPYILRFMTTMGAWDYEMDVEVESPEDVTKITDALRARFSERLHSLHTTQIFRHLKYSSYPF